MGNWFLLQPVAFRRYVSEGSERDSVPAECVKEALETLTSLRAFDEPKHLDHNHFLIRVVSLKVGGLTQLKGSSVVDVVDCDVGEVSTVHNGSLLREVLHSLLRNAVELCLLNQFGADCF